ncbi:hypothetical protein H1C71_008259, partial [Ictidomys tridecemlineatus]
MSVCILFSNLLEDVTFEECAQREPPPPVTTPHFPRPAGAPRQHTVAFCSRVPPPFLTLSGAAEFLEAQPGFSSCSSPHRQPSQAAPSDWNVLSFPHHLPDQGTLPQPPESLGLQVCVTMPSAPGLTSGVFMWDTSPAPWSPEPPLQPSFLPWEWCGS